MQVRWTETAARDLEEIFEFVRQESDSRARAVAELLFDSAVSLSSMPNRGRRGRLEGTRELIVPSSPYIIVYRVVRPAIQILRIYHGAREWLPQDFESKPQQ